MTRLIRIAPAVLFLGELVFGGWNAAAPENFYHNFPTVNLTPQNLRPEAQAAGAA